MKSATTNSHHVKPSGRLTSLARLAVVLVLAASSIATHASLVAHWTFDESSGPTAHDSAGSFQGMLSTGSAAFVAGGISGNAISLSRASNGFVNMGDVLGLTSGDFSIVAWIKMSPGEQMQNLMVEILDLPRGQQQGLYLGLGRHEDVGCVHGGNSKPDAE